MTIAMILPAPGEPPRWGENGAPTAIDPKIEAARTSTVEEQEKLFFHCARYLYDNQVREGVDLRIDPVNNEPWLDALAAWFGWDTERREAVRNKAAAAAMVVLPGETFDGTEPHDR